MGWTLLWAVPEPSGVPLNEALIDGLIWVPLNEALIDGLIWVPLNVALIPVVVESVSRLLLKSIGCTAPVPPCAFVTPAPV